MSAPDPAETRRIVMIIGRGRITALREGFDLLDVGERIEMTDPCTMQISATIEKPMAPVFAPRPKHTHPTSPRASMRSKR